MDLHRKDSAVITNWQGPPENDGLKGLGGDDAFEDETYLNEDINVEKGKTSRNTTLITYAALATAAVSAASHAMTTDDGEVEAGAVAHWVAPQTRQSDVGGLVPQSDGPPSAQAKASTHTPQ